MTRPKNFALIGAAGFVAPRHMRAIDETGNRLVAAVDPHDSVGILDRYAPEARFFTEIERFDRHLEKLRRAHEPVDYVSICSPNYLHDAHVRLALRVGAHAICEKPLVISPWNLDALSDLEAEGQPKIPDGEFAFEDTFHRVFPILQLRLHPAIVRLREQHGSNDKRVEVVLTYVVRRGSWYGASWKGSEAHSGGVAMNIGIHFFDALMWIFGAPEQSSVNLWQPRRASGTLELERARVRWFVSVDEADLPPEAEGPSHRALTLDGEHFDFSSGFEDLHTRQYEEILAGRGFGIEDTRASIDVVHALRKKPVMGGFSNAHPLLRDERLP